MMKREEIYIVEKYYSYEGADFQMYYDFQVALKDFIEEVNSRNVADDVTLFTPFKIEENGILDKKIIVEYSSQSYNRRFDEKRLKIYCEKPERKAQIEEALKRYKETYDLYEKSI